LAVGQILQISFDSERPCEHREDFPISSRREIHGDSDNKPTEASPSSPVFNSLHSDLSLSKQYTLCGLKKPSTAVTTLRREDPNSLFAANLQWTNDQTALLSVTIRPRLSRATDSQVRH
jgi:hypothetical protein